jgi:transcriptional regulator with XRE-family HTH domain
MKKTARLRVSKKHARLGIPVPGPLRLRRFTAGVTLADAARRAGVSLSRASYIERGAVTDPKDAAALDRAVTALASVRP